MSFTVCGMNMTWKYVTSAGLQHAPNKSSCYEVFTKHKNTDLLNQCPIFVLGFKWGRKPDKEVPGTPARTGGAWGEPAYTNDLQLEKPTVDYLSGSTFCTPCHKCVDCSECQFNYMWLSQMQQEEHNIEAIYMGEHMSKKLDMCEKCCFLSLWL